MPSLSMMADVSTISGSSSIAIKPVPSLAPSLFVLAPVDAAVVLAAAELVDAEFVEAKLADAEFVGVVLLAWVFIAASLALGSGKPPATRGDAFNAAAKIATFVNSWRILCPLVRNATLSFSPQVGYNIFLCQITHL